MGVVCGRLAFSLILTETSKCATDKILLHSEFVRIVSCSVCLEFFRARSVWLQPWKPCHQCSTLLLIQLQDKLSQLNLPLRFPAFVSTWKTLLSHYNLIQMKLCKLLLFYLCIVLCTPLIYWFPKMAGKQRQSKAEADSERCAIRYVMMWTKRIEMMHQYCH